MAKKVALVIAAQGFQQVEYGIPKKMLEDAGIEVITISNKPGTARAVDGSTTKVDLTLDKANIKDYDAIYLIGGSGALENIDTHATHKFVQEAARLGKPYGAICIATRVLANAHVLHEKQATGWNDDGLLPEILQTHNAVFVDQGVVVDGNVITATGPEAAEEFAEEILKQVA